MHWPLTLSMLYLAYIQNFKWSLILLFCPCNFNALGKSGIHGFGIFAKHPHRAGDMVN